MESLDLKTGINNMSRSGSDAAMRRFSEEAFEEPGSASWPLLSKRATSSGY